MKFLKNYFSILLVLAISISPVEAIDQFFSADTENFGQSGSPMVNANPEIQTWEDLFDSYMHGLNYVAMAGSIIYVMTKGNPFFLINKFLPPSMNANQILSLTSIFSMAQEKSGIAYHLALKSIQSPYFIFTMGAAVLSIAAGYVYQHLDSPLGLWSNVHNVTRSFYEHASWLAGSSMFILQKLLGYTMGITVVGGVIPFIYGKTLMLAEPLAELNIAVLRLGQKEYRIFKFGIVLIEVAAILPFFAAMQEQGAALLTLQANMSKSFARLDLGQMQDVFFGQTPKACREMADKVQKIYSHRWGQVKGYFQFLP
jgi:hypothetical protein